MSTESKYISLIKDVVPKCSCGGVFTASKKNAHKQLYYTETNQDLCKFCGYYVTWQRISFPEKLEIAKKLVILDSCEE